MKTVKIKPFGVFKMTQEAVESVKKQTFPESESKGALKNLIKKRKSDNDMILGFVYPKTNELFTMIPVIKGDRMYGAKFPDPIQLYFSLAHANFEFSRQTYYNITLQNRPNTYLSFVNQDLYNSHLQYKINSIIFLHSTVEAFINYITPDNYIYKRTVKVKGEAGYVKKIIDYTKKQTEREVPFIEKVSILVPQITKIEFKKTSKNIYDKLRELNNIRNDIIHLKSSVDGNSRYFERVFSKVIHVDLDKLVQAVQQFVNTIKPDFLEYSEIPEKLSDSTITFEFEDYGTYILDFSVFLKVLDAPAKKVILNIPISTDEDSQALMNWIMQNINIMVEMQLIYSPIITEEEQKIKIEITKTGREFGKDPDWYAKQK